MTLTLSSAEEYIRRAKSKAQELGIHMSFAVVDDTGNLVASVRMDGALWLTIDIARGKAYTAMAFRRPSKAVAERFKDRPAFLNSIVALAPGKLVPGAGGIPIEKDSEIIGAIGASGGTPDEDEMCVQAAVG